ncbi:glutathione S-transferase [Bradyrhizobium sp. CB82]|uniref:glutathione S-transferase N-terminal domain-containing protein n=1 Tax=Bradyrhizobium sp. CB82 TaxID=3039159 RepID=UPI0024B0746F|nr:glutathione S-transferase N-terminal domain-containing protein [Bradyrhizobium sp. CB82]WFU38323.1 glutathione S-transferase [Bradyrhizobium sp. CB82]
MLQLYGNTRSRATRCLWMLEEIGQPYELIERSTRADDLQTPDYLRLNPNARIPTLVDGDLVLWESMAINLYLAQKFDGPMHCGPEVAGLAFFDGSGTFSGKQTSNVRRTARRRRISRVRTPSTRIAAARWSWTASPAAPRIGTFLSAPTAKRAA